MVESYDANNGRHSTASRVYACARRQTRRYSVSKVSVAMMMVKVMVKSEVLER